jgi:hypothetical protein
VFVNFDVILLFMVLLKSTIWSSEKKNSLWFWNVRQLNHANDHWMENVSAMSGNQKGRSTKTKLRKNIDHVSKE